MIKRYEVFPEEAMEIRKEVFVEEQGFEDEFDEIDAGCIHLVAFDGEKAVGTCRIFYDDCKESYLLGRLAIRKPWREKGVGSLLLKEAEKVVVEKGGRSLMLHSQCAASAFYEKNGYQKLGEIEPEQGCPHVWMGKWF